jgi:hypothetical protein
MANMLSAQLATMKLNVIQPINSKSVDGNALIFAGTAPARVHCPRLNVLGQITVNDLITAANSAFQLQSGGVPEHDGKRSGPVLSGIHEDRPGPSEQQPELPRSV